MQERLKNGRYLDDQYFYYQMIISLGKGKLTRVAEKYIYLICINIMKKLVVYQNKELMDDFVQDAFLKCYEVWVRFSPKRYESPLNYFTEIVKRSYLSTSYINQNLKSYDNNKYTFISIDRSNDGKGLHSF